MIISVMASFSVVATAVLSVFLLSKVNDETPEEEFMTM